MLTVTTVSRSCLWNQIWPLLEFQRFFAWPRDPCYFVWVRARTVGVSWPLAQPAGWSLGSVNLHSRLGPREVGGVPGMLWRTRILRDVLFFCKLLRKWCVYVYVCCLELCLCASNVMLLLFGALRSQSLIIKLKPGPKFSLSWICSFNLCILCPSCWNLCIQSSWRSYVDFM